MKAAVLNQSSYKLEIREVNQPVLSESDVLVRLKTAALNHRELWFLQQKKIKSETDIIMGSDGSGIVEDLGPEVERSWIGTEVIINPSINWGPADRVQGKGFEILGVPGQGTFTEYISIDSRYIHRKPPHLSVAEAAAIPLAGLTAFRALCTRGEYVQGNTVLVTGIGGGAALFALQFATVLGARVFVTSGDDEKIRKAIEMGATGGVNYTKSNWARELHDKSAGFDVIIDSAAGKGFSDFLDLINPGGRIVLFGRTAGEIQSLNPRTLYWKQVSIHGTTMGTGHEFKNMAGLVSEEEIHPVIDSVFPLDRINAAFEKMERGEQFGKILINIEN